MWLVNRIIKIRKSVMKCYLSVTKMERLKTSRTSTHPKFIIFGMLLFLGFVLSLPSSLLRATVGQMQWKPCTRRYCLLHFEQNWEPFITVWGGTMSNYFFTFLLFESKVTYIELCKQSLSHWNLEAIIQFRKSHALSLVFLVNCPWHIEIWYPPYMKTISLIIEYKTWSLFF